MSHRNVLYVVLASVVLLVGLLGAISMSRDYTSAIGQGLASLLATPIHHYGAESGPITATLISPDDVSLQIVSIQKEPTMWLFHIHAHNNSTRRVTILDTATSHYFDLGLRGIPGTPQTWSESGVQLQPATQELLGAQVQLATHPALNATVAGGADSDGWLVANLATTTYPPFQLFYIYGTVTAPSCPNLTQNPSTCPTTTAYRTLVWSL